MLFLRASELAARILPALTVFLVIMSTVMVGCDRAERTEIITDAENAASSTGVDASVPSENGQEEESLETAATPVPKGRRRALLVGCTTYDDLPE